MAAPRTSSDEMADCVPTQQGDNLSSLPPVDDPLVTEAETYLTEMTTLLHSTDLDLQFLDRGLTLHDHAALAAQLHATAHHPRSPSPFDPHSPFPPFPPTPADLAYALSTTHHRWAAVRNSLEARAHRSPPLRDAVHDALDRRMRAAEMPAGRGWYRRGAPWTRIAARLRHLLHAEHERATAGWRARTGQAAPAGFRVRVAARHLYDGTVDGSRIVGLWFPWDVGLGTVWEGLRRASRNGQTGQAGFADGYTEGDGNWVWVDPAAPARRKIRTEADLREMVEWCKDVHARRENVVLVFHEKYEARLAAVKEEHALLIDRRFYEEEPTDGEGRPLFERECDFVAWCREHPDADGSWREDRDDEEYWRDIVEYRKRIGLE